MKKIFVSYSRADGGDFADHVSVHYEREGHQIFIDKDDIKLGEDWSERIKNSIGDSDVVAVIATRSALRSLEVEKEVEEAKRQKKTIIPCVYKGIPWVDLKWDLNKLQGFDFDNKNSLVRQLDEMIFENKSPIKNQPKTVRPTPGKKSRKIIIVSIISAISVVAVVIGIMQYSGQDAFQPNNTSIINTNNTPISIPGIAQDNNELFLAGMSSYKGNDYSDAVDSFNKFLQLEPNNASALYLKGSSQYELQNYSDAVGSFNKFLQLEPNNASALYLKGSSQYELQNYSDAVGSFNEYLQTEPNNTQALLSNGMALYRLNDFTDAIDQFDKVLAEDPTNKNALLYKGLSLYGLNRNNEAIAQFNRVLANDPEDQDALLYKGLSLYDLQRYDEAIAYYDQLLQKDPNNMNATQEKEKAQQAKANQSNFITTQ